MQLFDILADILNLENIDAKLNSTKQKRSITVESLLSALCNGEESVAATLGINDSTYTRTLRFLWPEKPAGKLRNYLLAKYDYKLCGNCGQVKEDTEFSKNSARRDGLNSHCRECCLDTRREYQRTYRAQMRALKLQRTPAWSETDEIIDFYNNCPIGYHVDHIVPLQGKTVSGLHVLTNLQYLLASENQSKGNKFSE